MELPEFLDQLSMTTCWDIACIQEGFRKLDGLDAGHHALFTPPALQRGLRCPAVVVHSRWAGQAKYAGGGERWIAIDFMEEFLVLSAHFPPRRSSKTRHAFTTMAEELRTFVQQYVGARKVVLGMDFNAKLAGMSDWDLVGPAVPVAQLDAEEWERAGTAMELIHALKVSACNMWDATQHEDLMYTRSAWGGEGGKEEAQIDFMLASANLKVLDVGVIQHANFKSDHRPVHCELRAQGSTFKPTARSPCLRNWQPAPGWQDAASSALGCGQYWQNWEEAAQQVRTLAGQHKQPKKALMEDDETLGALLAQRRSLETPVDERRQLNKMIWRRRRHLRREKGLRQLEAAEKAGKAPPSKRGSSHVNWGKLADGKPPRELLTKFYSELYSLPPSENEASALAEQQLVDAWRFEHELCGSPDSRIVNEKTLDKAMRKLKKGKNSPDGITAEMLQELPPDARKALEQNLAQRCTEMDFPVGWTRSAAILAPKVAAPASLAKYRPITCLCTMRKLLGYLWLASLPVLVFLTAQTAFVPGAHACMGVHTILRAAELAREWRQPLFLAQLDLEKAFDRLDHRAAFEAMRMFQVPLDSMAMIARIWQKSSLTVRLGGEASDEIPLPRGLPQGAPESPLVFTMVVEMLIRRLEAKWRKKRYGWRMDGICLFVICYADDILLLARNKKMLEAMLADVVEAFLSVGLTIGAPKTHWTSTPPCPGSVLSVGGHEVQWESGITYVGTILDLTGSATAAIHHRMARAAAAVTKWWPLLRAKWIPLARRAELISKAIWSSLLWCACTWTTTKAQRNKLRSWGARTLSKAAGIRRGHEEPIEDWWRRLHRVGHTLVERHITNPLVESRLLAHRWAGHVARLPADHFMAQIVRCRGMQWWRWRQEQNGGPLRPLLHPQRFKVWRWEQQFSQSYGDGLCRSVSSNTGWLSMAQDRADWKSRERSWAEAA